MSPDAAVAPPPIGRLLGQVPRITSGPGLWHVG